MMVKRYFCEKSPYKNQMMIEGDEFFHLKNVMRGKVGDEVEIVNGRGDLFLGKITEIIKSQALIHIQKTKKQAHPLSRIIIAPSLLKIKPMNEMIEKLSEMGIDEIRPVICHRTESIASASKLKKWNKIAQQSLKVNKNLWQTSIFDPVKVEKIIKFSKKMKTKLLLDQNGSEQVKPVYTPPVISLIGPPGDFTKKEKELFIKNGFIPIKINACTLRSETAAIAIGAILKRETYHD